MTFSRITLIYTLIIFFFNVQLSSQQIKYDCNNPTSYDQNEFRANVKICDGIQNCLDGSDEICNINLYPCTTTTLNLPTSELDSFNIKKCDGQRQCTNGLDEKGCFVWGQWTLWGLTSPNTEDDNDLKNCWAVRTRECLQASTGQAIAGVNCASFSEKQEVGYEDMDYDELLLNQDLSQEAVSCEYLYEWLLKRDSSGSSSNSNSVPSTNQPTSSVTSATPLLQNRPEIEQEVVPSQPEFVSNPEKIAQPISLGINPSAPSTKSSAFNNPVVVFGIIGGVLGLIVVFGLIFLCKVKYWMCFKNKELLAI